MNRPLPSQAPLRRRIPLFLPAITLAIGITAAPVLRLHAPALALVLGLLALVALAAKLNRQLLGAAVLLSVLLTGALLGTSARHEPLWELSETPLAQHADATMPPRLAGFTRAVVLGDLNAIDAIDRLNYRRAGLTHLLAISGFNVAIMALLVRAFLALAPLRRAHVEYASAAAIAVYVAGIGAPPSVLRAGIMAVLLFIARGLGRGTDGLNVLCGAFFITLLFNPAALYDIGFQLSYAATWGMILWTAPLEAVLPARPRLLSKLVAGSFAAQALTLPLMAWHFQELAPIAFLANLAVIPIFGVFFPLVIFALVGIPFAASAATWTLEHLTAIIDAFAHMPGASFLVARPPLLMLYALLGIGALPLLPTQRARTLGLATFLVLIGLSWLARDEPAGVYVVRDDRGGLGVAVFQNGFVELLDDGLGLVAWKQVLSEQGASRVNLVRATSPAALGPRGVRDLYALLPVDRWEVPERWTTDAELTWSLRLLHRAGVAVDTRAVEHGSATFHGKPLILGDTAAAGTVVISRSGPAAVRVCIDSASWILRDSTEQLAL